MSELGIRRRWRALRTATRVEARALRLHPRRTLLLVALIALPVAALVGAATVAYITQPTPNERANAALGRAQLVVSGYTTMEQREQIEEALDHHPREFLEIFRGAASIEQQGRQVRSQMIAIPGDLEIEHGLAAPLLQHVAGQQPRNVGEVALSPSLLQSLGLAIGDRVFLSTGRAREIVGSFVDPEALRSPLLVRTLAPMEYRGQYQLLVSIDQQDAAQQAEALRALDYVVTTRSEASTADPAIAALIFATALLALFEASLVIAAAVSIGLRRRQRELGLIAANGAPPPLLQQAMVLSHLLLGLLAVVLGAMVGIAVTALVHPALDGLNHRLNGPFEVPWMQCAVALILGLLTTIAATWIPARRVAQMPVLEALGGRKPAASTGRRWLLRGAVLLMLGCLLLVLATASVPIVSGVGVVFGPIFAILGFGLSSPWLLGQLGRLVNQAPLTLRLAVRDAARFKERNAAVVTAILAGMAMTVTTAVLVESLLQTIEGFPAPLRDDQVLLRGPAAETAAARLEKGMPVLASAPLQAAYLQGEPLRVTTKDGGRTPPRRRPWVAIGSPELFDALALPPGADPNLHLLAVDVEPGAELNLRLTTWRSEKRLPALPIRAVSTGQRIQAPAFVVPQGLAQRQNLVAGPPPDTTVTPQLVRFEEPITASDLARVRRLVPDGVLVEAAVEHTSGVSGAYWAVTAICALTGLLIVAVATALSAAESADDEHTLHTLGAEPRLLKRHLAARASYLAFVGCLLAIPSGILCAVALFANAELPIDFKLPWWQLGLTLVGLPAIVGTTTRLLPRSVWSQRNAEERTGRRRLGCAVVALVLCAPDPVPANDDVVEWQERTVKSFGGRPVRAEIGRLQVPSRHGHSTNEAHHAIAFARLRSGHPAPGPPIFFLAGGPGGSGIEGAVLVATHPQLRLLEHGDVIGIDQRGVGESRPLLSRYARSVELPLDQGLTRERWLHATAKALQQSTRALASGGLDPHTFNTLESAHDIDVVRSALGYEKIVLYGASYGSHLALTYLREYPEHVARAVLVRTEGYEDTWKLPSTAERVLKQVDEWFSATGLSLDAGDSLQTRIARLHSQLSAKEAVARLPDPLNESGQTVAIGPWDLLTELAHRLGSVTAIERIPALVGEFESGDWNAIAQDVASARTAQVPLMAWLMDCSSGGPKHRLAQLTKERTSGQYLLGDALSMPLLPELCPSVVASDLGDSFYQARSIDVATLFVSGSLDPRTPLTNVEALLPFFPNAAHVVIENAAHESRELMSAQYRRLLQQFLRGETVRSTTIRLPRPVPRPSSFTDDAP